MMDRSELTRHLHTHQDHAGLYPAGHDFVLVSTADIRDEHARLHRRGHMTHKHEPPRCEERCEHQQLRYCDECANIPRMARWAKAMTSYELAAALEKLINDSRYYTFAERAGVLTEAGRRIRLGRDLAPERRTAGSTPPRPFSMPIDERQELRL